MHNGKSFLCSRKRRLTAGYMVNFRASTLQPEDEGTSIQKPEIHILPDSILHPRRAARKSGLGLWVSLRHDIVGRLLLSGPHQHMLSRVKAQASPRLVEMVRVLLQQRIMQELQLLRQRMKMKVKRPSVRIKEGGNALIPPKPILRRLSQEEADALQEQMLSEDENVIAFIDMSEPVPPAKDAAKDAVVAEAAEEAIKEDVTQDAEDTIEDKLSDPTVKTPRRKVPLYNFTHLLSGERQAEARGILGDILELERREARFARHTLELASKQNVDIPAREPTTDSSSRGGSKKDAKPIYTPSNILALSSYPTITGGIRRGDVGVDLAIALLRSRMYEGSGWREFIVDRQGRRV